MDPLSDSQRKHLWKHQAEAIDFAIEHGRHSSGPCLIRMPTGTGKTGVIACLTRLANHGASSLVLTPWAHLRDQMVSDVETAFWRRIRLTPPAMRVVPITPSSAKQEIAKGKPTVFVTTFATLNQLRVDWPEIYKQLRNVLSLVIVDEGHYEPAVEWSKSVKSLNCKTILLTATPYRNDLKLFRIEGSASSSFHYTHRDAASDKIIRELKFRDVRSAQTLTARADAFVNEWKGMKRDAVLPSKSPRAILCCAGADDIRTVVSRLRDQGLSAIGIHDRFKSSRLKYLVEDVPDPRTEDSEIWVHQHKLTEGLDDSRFCCVGLLTRIKNDRKLIQQIGGILRRGADEKKSAPALLVAPTEWSVHAEWAAYRKFETDFRLLDPSHFREVVDKLLVEQPEVEYFDGKFRTRFRPDELSSNPQVLLSPSVLARRTRPEFSLPQYIEDCTDTLNTKDAVILGPNINGPCKSGPNYALWVYASVKNSRSLGARSLYEIRLETHCVVVAEKMVLVCDSRGYLPQEYLEDYTSGFSPSQLAKFLDKTFRPTSVSVDNSIPYDSVVRGSDLRGHDLLRIPTSLTDRVQICRSARGHSKKYGGRYVGMTNGRLRSEVSEEIRRQFDLSEFVSWAQGVAKTLDSDTKGNELFDRFMPTCAPPDHPVPMTLSIDLLRFDLQVSLDDEPHWRLKSSSSNIERGGTQKLPTYKVQFDFEGPENAAARISLKLEYQPQRRRFWFTKEEGPSIKVEVVDDASASEKSFADFLNQKQDVLLIGLEGGSIVYQARNFYKVDYSYAEKALFSLIVRPTNAPLCRTEKGTEEQLSQAVENGSTSFPKASLFRAIAREELQLPFDCDVLVCDDMGTECADFVAASLEHKYMALIHAKIGSGAKVSASAFHEIASQAMKNLTYLTRSAGVPRGAGSWRRDRFWKRTRVSRLIKHPATSGVGARLWGELQSEIVHGSNPQLFVVLVTAGCCDVNELKMIAGDPSLRTPESAQLVHLLDGLNSHAKQLGVRLLICDLPFRRAQKKKAGTTDSGQAA